jgi:methyl-accepting chemotaxis protein
MLTNFMRKASTTGNIVASNEERQAIGRFMASHDETGTLVQGCDSFINHIINVSKDLGAIASGDLTVDVSVLSDVDLIGISLKTMVENLSNTFDDIDTSVTHVASGSSQTAEGAQALAQGAMEQAASIQELTNEIDGIADMAKSNTEVTIHTTELMDKMMAAVKEIDSASESISKIINTIDDIAFQTNILALNAAVEAARAGQYGRGFAVVAEEVRNLASKSAEAAKDTGVLIANSMEKTKVGVHLANETATGIMGIAKSSKEQSSSIEQVQTGISQIGQVVQNNSSIAQQSAATSQQISSQSAMLKELISHFRTCADKAPRHKLLPGGGGKAARKQLALQ